MFRQAAEADTPLGKRLREYMDRGDLVPDSLTNELVEVRIGEPDASKGFVLDGYPRSVDQAEMLDRALAGRGVSLDRAIKFMITGPEIVRRLSARRVCPVDGSVYNLVTHPPRVPGRCDVDGTPLVQREDDREETVLRRLEVYGKSTKPLYDLYAERGILVPVDAIGSTDEVFERLLEATEIDQEQGAGTTGTGKAGR
jgi:adenylate kinase